MNRRPLPVTIISFVLIATGAIGLVYHLADFRAQAPFPYELVWISVVRLTAIVCGLYLLRARNWARWLALAWIAFHVIVSAFQAPLQLVIHIVVFLAFAYFLFRPGASEYFHGAAAFRSAD